MRSIRLSLVTYFLGLLVVALGVASVLVYRTAQRSLREKEEALRNLIEARHKDRVEEKKKKLDDQLLTQAQSLARRVGIQFHWNRNDNRHVHAAAGLFGAYAVPCAHLTTPLWVLQAPTDKRARGRYPYTSAAYEIWRTNVTDLSLAPIELDVGEEAQFYQIESNGWSGPLRSLSLEKAGLQLPDEQGFAPDEVLSLKYDNVEVAPGKEVRRVRLKVARAKQIATPRLPGPRRPDAPPGGGAPVPAPPPPPPSGSRSWPQLAIIIQCAADTRPLEAALGELHRERDQELESLGERTAASLEGQRNRLLGISGFTFTATVFGCLGLVWLGLKPLQRLSDAVSRVSAKDFRLPLDSSRPLPRELQPIAQRLGGALEMLKRAFAREKQATADISHELRTPLAALLTTTELALRKPRSAEHYRELLQDCRLSAQQMNQIVERLLTLARLDAGVDLLRLQSVDVSDLAEQCAAVVRPLAEARGLSLAVHKAPAENGDGARLMTDPDKLREVLTNLLHNAIQYNRPEGAVVVKVGRGHGHVGVEVSDTGIGIAPEAREHIFERFYRADPSRNTDDLHAGLGLAIVKEYVDLMGGAIEVESAEGKGSTFRVRLPAA